ncbi:unnamed protein product [Rhizophagus irregularis]|nr:unnamed protein product [Rhizophagus irregularis]CAB4460585.1 unnamed protein product [Rhizophagus irregularis]
MTSLSMKKEFSLSLFPFFFEYLEETIFPSKKCSSSRKKGSSCIIPVIPGHEPVFKSLMNDEFKQNRRINLNRSNFSLIN